jgi:predicted Fe-S protein YdhL (DUF1289 family)
MSVESPCLSVCELDENNVCKGCFRTLEEIGRWPLANDIQRKEFLRLSKARHELAYPEVSRRRR